MRFSTRPKRSNSSVLPRALIKTSFKHCYCKQEDLRAIYGTCSAAEMFSNYGDFQNRDKAWLTCKRYQDRSLRRPIGMLGLQRKLKTILMILITIYLCINIYHTSRSILQNEAQIALLKKVLNKPLCVAHQKTIKRLRRLTKDLTYVRMSVDRDVAMARIIDGHYDNLRKLLREIELITRTNVDEDGRKRFSDDEAKESQVVCPEVYKGSIHGYPFYTKGFETPDCSLKRDMKELVTLIFDEVVVTTATGVENNTSIQSSRVDQLLTFIESVYRLFPAITVNVVLGKNWNQRELEAIKNKLNQNNLRTKVFVYSLKSNGFNKGELLQSIINRIKTEYTLIAPRLTNFTNDINLERLVRILSSRKNTLFAGGSFRNLTGHWSRGCLQMQLKNYTLSYKAGYYRSFSECLVCDYTPGPFLAKTFVLRDIGFGLSGEHGIFRDLFLRVKDRYSSSHSHPGLDHGGTAVVTCPDVMFHTQNSPARDEDLLNFANKHNIKKIVEADGTIRWFGCRRGLKYRNGEKCPLKSGLAVPPCCLENIADAIKFVMEQCSKNNITCELQEGTLLGAVKMNKVLPWERDADVTFLTADFPKLVKIKDVFTRQGYVIHDIRKYNK